MIRINLLPHREEAKKRGVSSSLCSQVWFPLGALIVFAGYTLIGNAISNQEGSNEFLKREIAVLDKQLDQIKRLKEQTQALLARKQVIENLQRDRGETVYAGELVKQVPEGIYLKSMKQDGLKVSLIGHAQSNARISALMRNLEASPGWSNRN
jgi:type IV pilus assembly protein PilN